ncbi:M15 family metallopeptidase [Arcicella aquatica]|uniref:D-alanyl-D-alanine dipeptidase n=1 Tax=Arcicella aquatica TaxID=217141 RepID=A0ABU5QJP6_9BACT|nr:M15 family metallopeptidase [Arcicella aquatica]MEA5256701.1 M15 family metallopeptidase [Arcicella aquatica]
MRKQIFCLLLFVMPYLVVSANAKEVKVEKNDHNPPKNLKKKPQTDCEYEQKMAQQGLVNIQEIDPSVLVELKYSTTDNFVGKDVYGCITNCFMQKRPAKMLKQANTILQQKHPNYRLLVYDGGRPHSIQKILWNTLTQYTPKERAKYVANPAEGSIHNYGSAVDLTIATADGKALDMGTKYDYFGALAYPIKEDYFLDQKKLTKQQVANRILLRTVMKSAGFTAIDYEWWHFNAVSRRVAKQIYQIIE